MVGNSSIFESFFIVYSMFYQCIEVARKDPVLMKNGLTVPSRPQNERKSKSPSRLDPEQKENKLDESLVFEQCNKPKPPRRSKSVPREIMNPFQHTKRKI